MKTYIILRRNAWQTADDLKASAELSTRVGNEIPDRVRWIRSYVVREDSGQLATVCVYQGADEEAVREHARRAKMRADEVLPVLDTVIVRPDPQAEREAA